jgi:hypothetical protein
MSNDSDDSLLPEPLRSVTAPSRTHPDASMDAIGWGIALGLVILLLPLLPFIIIVWGISKVTEALTPS